MSVEYLQENTVCSFNLRRLRINIITYNAYNIIMRSEFLFLLNVFSLNSFYDYNLNVFNNRTIFIPFSYNLKNI